MTRLIIGFLFCAVAYPGFILLLGGMRAMPVAAVAALFTFTSTFVLGLPLFVWHYQRGWWKLWQFLAGGSCIGALASLLFLAGGGGALIHVTPTFAMVGAAHATVFWLTAVWRNTPMQNHFSSNGREAAI
ncbi:MAG TPA: hypothetical protein VF522_21965 [Ramlibacter sp.]|uniref:hypothetical protein n=1 Tax=Ramlibacter sp. TaxID=1917967 RepID=UPI002ED607BB